MQVDHCCMQVRRRLPDISLCAMVMMRMGFFTSTGAGEVHPMDIFRFRRWILPTWALAVAQVATT